MSSDQYGDYIRMRSFRDVLIRPYGPEADGTLDWAFDYIGCEHYLIAAGVCTTQMLAPAARKGPYKRFDSDGIHFTMMRWFVRRDGKPVERLKLALGNRSAALALKLPGAAEAMSHWRQLMDRRSRNALPPLSDADARAQCEAAATGGVKAFERVYREQYLRWTGGNVIQFPGHSRRKEAQP